jgi:hypothetical protein
MLIINDLKIIFKKVEKIFGKLKIKSAIFAEEKTREQCTNQKNT